MSKLIEYTKRFFLVAGTIFIIMCMASFVFQMAGAMHNYSHKLINQEAKDG